MGDDGDEADRPPVSITPSRGDDLPPDQEAVAPRMLVGAPASCTLLHSRRLSVHVRCQRERAEEKRSLRWPGLFPRRKENRPRPVSEKKEKSPQGREYTGQN